MRIQKKNLEGSGRGGRVGGGGGGFRVDVNREVVKFL